MTEQQLVCVAQKILRTDKEIAMALFFADEISTGKSDDMAYVLVSGRLTNVIVWHDDHRQWTLTEVR